MEGAVERRADQGLHPRIADDEPLAPAALLHEKDAGQEDADLEGLLLLDLDQQLQRWPQPVQVDQSRAGRDHHHVRSQHRRAADGWVPGCGVDHHVLVVLGQLA